MKMESKQTQSIRTFQHIIHPRKGRHHAGEAKGRCGEQNDVTDFVGRTAGLDHPTGVAVRRAFQPRTDGQSKLYESAHLQRQRTSFLRSLAERLVSL